MRTTTTRTPIKPGAKRQIYFLRALLRPSCFLRVESAGAEPRKSQPMRHHP
jgi:hypothetical protein